MKSTGLMGWKSWGGIGPEGCSIDAKRGRGTHWDQTQKLGDTVIADCEFGAIGRCQTHSPAGWRGLDLVSLQIAKSVQNGRCQTHAAAGTRPGFIAIFNCSANWEMSHTRKRRSERSSMQIRCKVGDVRHTHLHGRGNTTGIIAKCTIGADWDRQTHAPTGWRGWT